MSDNGKPPSCRHFQGKDAVEHVAEAKAKGIIASAELHGTELPGHLSAGLDAAKESAIILLLVQIVLYRLQVDFPLWSLLILSSGLFLWKTGRSAVLGWSRLERMHRIVDQERWEIQHHRQQERDELKELYRAKGLEGKLLDDVMDVMMADEERLLKIMVEEELCLNLESQEHPLKQAAGAGAGVAAAALVCGIGLLVSSIYGILGASLLVVAVAAASAAHLVGNKRIPAMVWNTGIAVLASGAVFFLLQLFQKGLNG